MTFSKRFKVQTNPSDPSHSRYFHYYPFNSITAVPILSTPAQGDSIHYGPSILVGSNPVTLVVLSCLLRPLLSLDLLSEPFRYSLSDPVYS